MICLFLGDKSKWIKLRLKREKYFSKWKENIKFHLPSQIFIEQSQGARKHTRTESLYFLSARCLCACQSRRDTMQQEWFFSSFHRWGHGQVWGGEGIAPTPTSSKWQGGPHCTACRLLRVMFFTVRGSLGIHCLAARGEERLLTARSDLGPPRGYMEELLLMLGLEESCYDWSRKRASCLRPKW